MMPAVNQIIKVWFSSRYWWLAILSVLLVISGQFILSNNNNIVNQNPVTPASNLPVTASPGWHPVTIGGGGYITGIYPHPVEADLVYLRTDNGGFFRWQAAAQKWLPITNSLPLTAWNYDHYAGGEALALDPQNPDIIYIAVGKYTSEPGTIYKSLDRGTTWQKSDLSVPMGGDEDKRWAGNRLVVSPYNANLLLFGSRQNGLWRSQDAGVTWTPVPTLPFNSEHHLGVLAIAFAPQVANLVYASVYDDGVYQSHDGGNNWKKLADSPTQVMKLAVAKDGVVYATSAKHPGVSKYTEGKWQDITPLGLSTKVFNGLSLHPHQPQTLIVSEGERGHGKIYYSGDRGNSWTRTEVAINNTVPWLAEEFFSDHTSAIAFDPQNPRRVWLTDWFSLWRTDNIQANPVLWQNYVAGIEQTVPLTLLAPPEGAVLLSGIADQEGFYHQDLTRYPQQRLGYQPETGRLNLKFLGQDYLDHYFQDTYQITYCVTQPQHLVRVGGKRWLESYQGATSQDGGWTWQLWDNFPASTMPLRVAMSAKDPNHLVVVNSEAQPLVSQDGGISWQLVLGLPDGIKGPWNWNQPLAADGAKGDRFYYYDQGQFYRSDNAALSFDPIGAKLPISDKYILQTIPEKSGEIWLSLDQQGLYHSTDGGASFTKIATVTTAHLLSIGKSLEGDRAYSPYIYGTLADGTSGLFTLLNAGQTWQQISQGENSPRALLAIEASKQQAGLVFAATDGRGIYYTLAQSQPTIDRS
ncbi:MAG TPA: WD40/YVTN/BNR-like repeat-containing protein [Xenococcaceae cyanobacterium]